ncbi:MAG TPA: peptidase M20 [Verrucomicrobiales bacterium]|nr:peptidase M20 [Verrucomicrobiales bacterium]
MQASIVTNGTDPRGLLERLTALTRDLALIPSTDARPEERRRCFEFCRNHLEALDGVDIREFEHNGYTSLVATPDHAPHPDVLLCGHLDVVEHPGRPRYVTRVDGGRIYGPGVGDMKGALAIMLELFRNLHRREPGLSLGLAITSDEERGGESGVRFLFEETGLRCSVAIIPDGGTLNRIIVEEKGILHLRLRARGHAAHAARPWLGNNALEHLADALSRLRGEFQALRAAPADAGEDHWYPTCAITGISTPNTSINRIPPDAEAVADIRFTPPHTAATLLERIRAIAGDGVLLEPIISAEPTHLSPDPEFVNVTEAVTGREAQLVRSSGGSDARFICRHGIPVLLSRPLVGELHSEDEWIDIESMGTYYRICEQYIISRPGAVR